MTSPSDHVGLSASPSPDRLPITHLWPALAALTVVVGPRLWMGSERLSSHVLCGFRSLTGLPCPGCGMTRSLAAMAHGELAMAAAHHAFGPLLFLLVSALGVWHGVEWGIGRRFGPRWLRWLLDERVMVPTFVGLLAYGIGRALAVGLGS